ncbi:hypothetical protein RI528_04255 [Aeromonas veronii]|uniref:hypothetical protein n=1 Tax=Aeromonas veronii TaxID=654 RepID=UPI00342E15AB
MKKTLLIIITIIACLSGILYYKEYNKNIFFIGNSITAYGLSPDIGWYGNWGMAASSEDNDFVHKTVEKLKNPRFQVINLGEFEYRYSAMDLSFLRPYKNAKPFVLVYQAGENVDPNKIDELKYTEHVPKLNKIYKSKNM